MKQIALFVKAEKNVQKQASKFEKWIQKKHYKVIRVNNTKYPEKIYANSSNDIFCIFVFGGDGTFLSAVRWMKKKQIPIIGVKFGDVGFLSEIKEEHLYQITNYILKGLFTTQYRMRLSVEITRKNEKIFNESILNDVVINKGTLARLAHIKTHIDNKFLTDYRADGLIIATPTGSTAYSLAAGGPIIYPSLNGILITPICPFTLTNRPLILPEKAIIKINLIKECPDLMLTFDGQIGIRIDQHDVIIIKKSKYPVKMISLPDQDYFDVLKTKLKWSGNGI